MNLFPVKSPLIFVPTLKIVRNATLCRSGLDRQHNKARGNSYLQLSLHVSCYLVHDAAGELGL